MKVSVITVCYNSESSIQKALDSVAEQSWPNIEHIVIDGASTDSTVGIVQANIQRISHFVSEPDSGVYQAMNKGLQLATGDLIAFLNSDDMFSDANVLEKVVCAMQDQGLDALYGDVEYFNASAPDRTVRTYDSGRFSPARIAWGWMPAHPALFVRRAVYEQYGCFREDYRIAGDFEFVARIFKNGQLNSVHLDQVLVRMQTGGLSTAGWGATYLLNKEILRACKQNDISSNWLMVLSKYFFKVREIFHV
jgi:glycosyltransferase involved in cell wall biosynthesis